jgi:hypothetical protein
MCTAQPGLAADPRSRLERQLRRGDQAELAARQARVAGFDRFALAALQQLPRGARQLDPVALHDGQRVGARAGVGHRRARGDVQQPVARHVGDGQREHARRVAGGGQPPALEGREMAAHAVHLADAGAAAQQRGMDALLLKQAERAQRRRQQRRAAAREQAQHQVLVAQTLHLFEQALRGGQAGGVRQRVGGFDDLDALTGRAVAVARHHQTRQRPVRFLPMRLDRLRHGRRGLAGTDDDQATAAELLRARQLGRQAKRRLGGGHGGVEHLAQQQLGRGAVHGGAGSALSDLLDELRLQAHGPHAVDAAVDVVVALAQADVLDLGADLHHQGRALDLQVFDHGDRVAVLQHIAHRVAHHARAVFGWGGGRGARVGLRRPLMAAFRTDELRAVFVGVGRLALGAGGQGAHGGSVAHGSGIGVPRQLRP